MVRGLDLILRLDYAPVTERWQVSDVEKRQWAGTHTSHVGPGYHHTEQREPHSAPRPNLGYTSGAWFLEVTASWQRNSPMEAWTDRLGIALCLLSVMKFM